MPHSPEGEAFLERLSKLPEETGVSLNGVLRASIDEEQDLRKLFATDKTNPRLTNPYVGLVDVFGPNTERIKKTHARVVKDEDDLSAHYVMPLKESQRRQDGTPSMAYNLEEFKKNWSIFTEGSLSQLFDWSNVVAAGGAVLSALSPLPEDSKSSKRAVRKFYHSVAYPTSDVDLFLWGLTAEQAEKKIVQIYEAVRDSVPWDVTCIRTKHTVSIHSQYPYRTVQIVLRLYQSPAEVLAGFDIDAPCCAYDGERVWANPRAIVAMMRQCNSVDMTRRSPSYEVRLAKYAKRNFEVFVPNLVRKDIDPTIYERSISKITGLARLLVLEKLMDPNARYDFLESRRQRRGRPFALKRSGGRKKRTYRGDLKADIGGLEMNDYDVTSLHIPYGPGWNAQRIEKLVYQTDLGMNSTFNPKNKGRRLHRHPAFFGTGQECMEDCCEHCPRPINEAEYDLQKGEDETYVRGRISFIQDNPGRQSLSGSFNPIDEGEWSEQAYIRPLEKLFRAISVHDRETVKKILAEKTVNLKNRDHVGRTALHLAILCKDKHIALDLIDAGCRMISRLVDGRTALHLAAQYDQHELITRMVEKSKANDEAAKKKVPVPDPEDIANGEEAASGNDTERPSSEDDWSSMDEEGGKDLNKEEDEDYDHCDDSSSNDDSKTKDKESKTEPLGGDMPEDEDEPDVVDINASAWDLGLTPLCYSILFASPGTVDVLIKNGADVNKAAVPSISYYRATQFHPLFLTLLRDDEGIAAEIAELLVKAGATSSTADHQLTSILHYAIFAQRVKILDTLLKQDPNAKKALNFPAVNYGDCQFPVVSALAQRSYSAFATLLSYGAKLNPDTSDVIRAKTLSGVSNSYNVWGYNIEDYSNMIFKPVETGIANTDYIVDLLFELGADVNVGIFTSSRYRSRSDDPKTILDWVTCALDSNDKRIASLQEQVKRFQGYKFEQHQQPQSIQTWKECLENIFAQARSVKANHVAKNNKEQQKMKEKELQSLEATRDYLCHVQQSLLSIGAKTWDQLRGIERAEISERQSQVQSRDPEMKPRYMFLSPNYRREFVQSDLDKYYDELSEAAFRGDDAKVEELCLGNDNDAGSSIVPLQVTVQTLIPEDEYRNPTGITPLYAAINGKKWNTARFILGIAAAQYHNEKDEEEEKMRASLFDLVDADDSDSEMGDTRSDYSDDSDETIDARERQHKLFDIAQKISVRTQVHPSLLLTSSVEYVINDTTYTSPLLQKAIKENDFETFVHLYNMLQPIQSPEAADEEQILQEILRADNPKFLDEYIRYTGVGIDHATIRQSSQDLPAVKNHLYLGLNVHGKKRADLARRGFINHHSPYVPLVWQAISAGARSVIEYLASAKPLIAYRFFAEHSPGDRAEVLRYTKNLDACLSEWLGWTVTSLGESPLTAAIYANQKDTLPVLFTNAPRVMATALHKKIKSLEFNALLLAAHQECHIEIFDFLLKKSVSPSEIDQPKGWNIYHWVCSKNNGDLLEYLLQRLPRKVSEDMLSQQSKVKLNTPLQIAVKAGNIRLVKILLKFSNVGHLTYDAYGFTPLHNAVSCGFRQILQELFAVLPKEALYQENGVGKTPYEDAEQRALRPLTESVRTPKPPTLLSNHGNYKYCLDIAACEKEVMELNNAIHRLISDGVLEKGTHLANALDRFASAMQTRLKEAEPACVEEAKESAKNPKEYGNHIEAYRVIAKAVTGNEAKRSLIRLADVQLSVSTDLAAVQKERVTAVNKDEFGRQDEGKEETETGMVFSTISVTGDEF